MVEKLQQLEENYSNDVVGELKKMMAHLEGPFKVNPEVLKGTFSTLADCGVSSQGVVSFLYRSGKIIRLPLEEVPDDTAFWILMEVIPQVETALLEQKDKLAKSGTRFTKIVMELRKVFGR